MDLDRRIAFATITNLAIRRDHTCACGPLWPEFYRRRICRIGFADVLSKHREPEQRSENHGKYAPVQEARPPERGTFCSQQSPPLADSYVPSQSRRGNCLRRQGGGTDRIACRSTRTDAWCDQRRLSQEYGISQIVASVRPCEGARLILSV